jgi:hypothetical protein
LFGTINCLTAEQKQVCALWATTRGRLKAAKAADGTWRSSAAWVEEYEASRYKRQ